MGGTTFKASASDKESKYDCLGQTKTDAFPETVEIISKNQAANIITETEFEERTQSDDFPQFDEIITEDKTTQNTTRTSTKNKDWENQTMKKVSSDINEVLPIDAHIENTPSGTSTSIEETQTSPSNPVTSSKCFNHLLFHRFWSLKSRKYKKPMENQAFKPARRATRDSDENILHNEISNESVFQDTQGQENTFSTIQDLVMKIEPKISKSLLDISEEPIPDEFGDQTNTENKYNLSKNPDGPEPILPLYLIDFSFPDRDLYYNGPKDKKIPFLKRKFCKLKKKILKPVDKENVEGISKESQMPE